MNENRRSESLSALGIQAQRILTEGTTWPELARELNIEYLRDGDKYANSHGQPTAFRPMCMAYLWAVTEDIKLSTIPSKLEDNPELAAAMGFNPDDLPSDSTFRPARLTSRFEDITSQIETTAKDIQHLANEVGSPIGYDPLSVEEINAEGEGDGLSKRSINRKLRSKSNDVLDEVIDVISPNIDFERPEKTQYSDSALLEVLAFSALKNEALNQGCEEYGDKANPNPDIENDPYYFDGPAGETVLEAIKNLSVDEVTELANASLKKSYLRAKPRLQELENDDGSRFGTRAKVAIDMTYVAYYGDREGMEWVQGAPDKKGYRWCHKFATIAIVGDNVNFVVGVIPVGSVEHASTDAYPGEDKSYRVGDVARRLLNIADEYVNVKRVYADREFYAADVIKKLEEDNLKYVIPTPIDDSRIQPKIDDFENLSNGYDESHDTPLYIEDEYAFYGAVRNEQTNHRVQTKLVILPPDEDDEAHEGDTPQPFVTNLDVDDEIALDRRYAYEQVDQYSDRGGIESSYSSIKECASYTTSKEFEVRWFHFMLATIIYNLWLLVDLLVQEAIGEIETRTKPRIKLNRFQERLKDALIRLI